MKYNNGRKTLPTIAIIGSRNVQFGSSNCVKITNLRRLVDNISRWLFIRYSFKTITEYAFLSFDRKCHAGEKTRMHPRHTFVELDVQSAIHIDKPDLSAFIHDREMTKLMKYGGDYKLTTRTTH